MNDAVRRAVRTYLQSAIGIFLGLWAVSGIDASQFGGLADLTILGKLAMGSLIGAIPALLSFVQNALEDKGTVPTLLKGRTTSDAGRGTLGLLGLVLAVVGALVLLLILLDVLAASVSLAVIVLVIGVVLLLVDGNGSRL